MKINELYKPKEIDQYRQEVKSGEIFPITINKKSDNTVTNKLMKYGFQPIGDGAFSTVYKHQSYPYVLKVFVKEQGYFEWLKFCQANQNNPYIPKIKGKFVRVIDNVYAVRLENLKELDSHDKNMFDTLFDEIDEGIYNYYDYIKSENGPNPHLIPIIDFLREYVDDTAELDLHQRNIMKRDNGQFVIIDPLVELNGDLWENKLFELQKPREISDFRTTFNQLYMPSDDETENTFIQNDTFDEIRKRNFYSGADIKGRVDDKSQLDNLMAMHDFHPIGAGGFATVYENDEYPFVLKVYVDSSSDRPGYKQWIDWCRNNQHNPFVPKIKGKTIRIVESIYATRLEKLYPIVGDSIPDKLRKMYKGWRFERIAASDLDPNLLEIFKFFSVGKVNFPDFQNANIMKRQDGQIVIIDPLIG